MQHCQEITLARATYQSFRTPIGHLWSRADRLDSDVHAV